jgi:hypothetical protein
MRLAEVEFASDADLRAIRAWAHAPRSGASQKALDAAEYAGLALEKLEMSRQRGRLARSLDELRRALAQAHQNRRTPEIIALLAARADWHRPAATLGFCLFRRSWAHNLFVDYLGTDPRQHEPGAAPIKGVGTGLLYGVMGSGQELDAGRCLIEATDESYWFYRKKFRMTEINDLFALTPAEQWHFMEQTRLTWRRSAPPAAVTF